MVGLHSLVLKTLKKKGGEKKEKEKSTELMQSKISSQNQHQYEEAKDNKVRYMNSTKPHAQPQTIKNIIIIKIKKIPKLKTNDIKTLALND